MFSHVFIGVNDFDRAFAFYSAVLENLDLKLRFNEPDKPWAAWWKKGASRPFLIIGKPYDGQAARSGNGHMVALLAPSRAAVDAAWASALENGGTDDGKPGLRPQYHPDYYGAYFHDPDGNKICVVCHDPLA